VAHAGLLQPRAAAQGRKERFGGGDDQRLEVAAGVGAHLEDLAARGVQHAQRLALATLARAGELVTRERFAASPNRIQWVALGYAATGLLPASWQSATLHRFPARSAATGAATYA
jgi:hypothetical protein